MQSSEPSEAHFNDPSHAARADESWRAEVASRVNSFRARRRGNGAEDNSPALDFGPASAGLASAGLTSAGLTQKTSGLDAQERRPQSHPGTNPAANSRRARAVANAFDTNYYRRLNAEAMAATATALELEAEREAEFEAASEVASEAASEASQPDQLPDRSPDQPGAESCPALDLEIRPAVDGDSMLDRPGLPIAPPITPAVVTPPVVAIPVAPAPAEQGNLIIFRRPLLEPPLLPQPSRDELAEPMNNRPRILEVPEDIMPAVQGSLFPEIRLDVDMQESSSPREPKIEVPLAVAAISERLMASLADLGVVLAAGLLFGAMAWRALPEIPHTKPFWMVLGVVTVLLWAVYQHLFLLYAGRTLGMSLRGIRLSTFDGRVPEWGQRGRRARSMFVSFAPVTLGFLWALVDEDELCWHDRISQTFPTSE